MEYLNIKGTGLKVSRFCLGTMMFGGQTEKDESVRIIDYALDNGVNFFDTADTYTGGRSEAIVGEALEKKRDLAVIATKVHNPKGPLPNQSGLGRKHIIQNVEESLTKLRTDYIDILYEGMLLEGLHGMLEDRFSVHFNILLGAVGIHP